MKIHVKESDRLVVPIAATPQSSGYDVVTLDEPKIVGELYQDATDTQPALWQSIDYIEYHTGLFTAPQQDAYGHNYHTLIFPRSSLRKYNLALANSIGLIDNDYRGEIILCFKYVWQPTDLKIKGGSVYGQINFEKIYKKGEKIGQLVSEVTNTVDWVVVADLSSTVRGTGGFGSTTEVKKVEAPKEAKSLVEKYKSSGGDGIPTPPKYETVAREREKLIS